MNQPNELMSRAVLFAILAFACLITIVMGGALYAAVWMESQAASLFLGVVVGVAGSVGVTYAATHTNTMDNSQLYTMMMSRGNVLPDEDTLKRQRLFENAREASHKADRAEAQSAQARQNVIRAAPVIQNEPTFDDGGARLMVD